MFQIRSSDKLLFISRLLAKFYTIKTPILSAVITNQCRLVLQLLGLSSLFRFGNFRSSINLNIFLCLLMPLALLSTSITYATNDHGKKITAVKPVVMSLNSPNNLAKYLADLESESVLDLHYFLKTMLQLEADGYESSCIDGSIVVFNQKKDIKFYSLYHLLSQRCYQGPSFGSFINHLIFNGAIQVISRQLLGVMLKFCNTYKGMEGMTIGSMLVDVEAQEHTDDNINTFLHYKANDAKAHYKNFYNENDSGTNSSANKSSGKSWLSRFNQQLGSYIKSIVKNVGGLASKAMCNASFIGSLMSPVGAFTCDEGTVIADHFLCDDLRGGCRDSSDEHASYCCEGGVQGINSTTRICAQNGNAIEKLFVCGNNLTIKFNRVCDYSVDCDDSSDQQASYCCEGGEQGINSTTRLCTKKTATSEKLFVCKDNIVFEPRVHCDGYNDCQDRSDEQASDCCVDGVQGIHSSNRTCLNSEKYNSWYKRFFVCNDNSVIVPRRHCDGHHNCLDGSDETVSDCCAGGVGGIDNLTSTCFNSGKYNRNIEEFYVCKDHSVLIQSERCNYVNNCNDGSDEQASDCCENGEQGINSTARTCVLSSKYNQYNQYNKELFVCKDNSVIPNKFRCDNKVHCYDGSDEHIHGTNSTCHDCGVNKGGLIFSQLRCNGDIDCSDRSDEKAEYCCKNGEVGIDFLSSTCEKKGDTGNDYFVCKDKQVVEDNRCNGNNDCVDGSDESIDGPNPICFKCGTGKSIDIKFLCNGQINCDDGSDEKALVCCKNGEKEIDSLSGTCAKKGDTGNDYFVCKDKQVVEDNRCNGSNDCIDGSDESIDGPNPICFKCATGKSIDIKFLCNGQINCGDGSDEHAAYCCKGGINGIKNSTSTCTKKGTQDTVLFACNNKEVILNELRCNNAVNCGDGSDEHINGTNPICFNCGVNNGGLIFSEFICDGSNQCSDGSDENAEDCCENGVDGIDNSTSICEKEGDSHTALFVCKNMRTIQEELRCNGWYDCNDGGDESINGTNPTCFPCDVNNETLVVSGSRCNGVNDCGDGSDESINGTNPTCFSCPGNNGTFIVSEFRCNDVISGAHGSDEILNGMETNALLYPAAALAVTAAVLPIIGCWVYDGLWLRKEKWIKAPITRMKQLFGWCCAHKKPIDKSKYTFEIELSNLEDNTFLKVDKKASNKMDEYSESIIFLQNNDK